jgi:hypothetical protein
MNRRKQPSRDGTIARMPYDVEDKTGKWITGLDFDRAVAKAAFTWMNPGSVFNMPVRVRESTTGREIQITKLRSGKGMTDDLRRQIRSLTRKPRAAKAASAATAAGTGAISAPAARASGYAKAGRQG